MERGVPYTCLAGVPKKLGNAPQSAEDGGIWREHTSVGRVAFQEDGGVARDEGFLYLLLNFVDIVADGIGAGSRVVAGSAG